MVSPITKIGWIFTVNLSAIYFLFIQPTVLIQYFLFFIKWQLKNIPVFYCTTWLVHKSTRPIIMQGRDTRSRIFLTTSSSVLHLPLMSIQLFIPTPRTSRVHVLSIIILHLHYTQQYSIRVAINRIRDNSTCIIWITSKYISSSSFSV